MSRISRKIVLVIILIAVIATVSTIFLLLSSDEKQPLTGEWVVFECDRAGLDGSVIYRVRPNGNDLQQLTEGSFFDEIQPNWSFNGNWIAFANGTGELYRMQSNGTEISKFLSPDDSRIRMRNPVWSPDGSLLAIIMGDSPGNGDVYLVELSENNNSRQLTFNKSVQNIAWSPNGEWILFASISNGVSNIYRIRPDGSDETNLTLGLSGLQAGYDPNPKWSPDSEWVVFSLGGQIYQMRNDGRDLKSLTSYQPQAPRASDAQFSPAYSPDGKWIIFIRGYGIYKMPSNGGEIIEILDELVCSPDNPNWGPPVAMN